RTSASWPEPAGWRSRSSTRSTCARRRVLARSRSRLPDERKSEGERRAPLQPSCAMNDAYLRVAALDVARLLAAAMLFRSWRQPQARPAMVALGFLVGLAGGGTIPVSA